MLTIDGSYGEGGGQIIRTSLALSLVSARAFRVERVRANRAKPGLQRQHLTAVKAAAEIGQGEVRGAVVGATEFTFVPGAVIPGDYVFDIGTAGSATLVLQTVLPPLMLASRPSAVRVQGGTHNVHAPPYQFLERTFLPLVTRTGPQISIQLGRYGFYPRGGGYFDVSIRPAENFQRLDLLERGPIIAKRGRALVVNLPESMAERELTVLRHKLGLSDEQLEAEISQNAFGAGTAVVIEIESAQLTELFTGIGERGVRAEVIAERAADEALRYLKTGAPVGEHLADQLLIPLALGRGGSFVTATLSLHTKTNIEIIKQFLDVEITTTQTSNGSWTINVRPPGV
jgi:RNA 3'-terminal phosphate cyclase (ATP)